MTRTSHRGYVFVLCLAALAVYACAVLPDSITTDCDSELRCPADSRCTAAGDACIPVGDTCGDGQIQPGEECDDGNRQAEDGCSQRCTREGSDGTCGNGFVDSELGEVCDDGVDPLAGQPSNEDGCPNGPNGTCMPAFCGDGFVWDGVEVCDPNVASDDTPCRSDCKGYETCGNGLLDPGELCDDGDDPVTGKPNNKDACPNDPATATEGQATCIPAFCGDGFLWDKLEECDPLDDAQCRSDCRGQKKCGNGLLDPGELCDDGQAPEGQDANKDACPNGENGSCEPAYCGDGFVWDPVEKCELGDTGGPDNKSCRNDCMDFPFCGNGLLDAGEACESLLNPMTGLPTDTHSCDSDCSIPVCGDQHRNQSAQEECDPPSNNGQSSGCASADEKCTSACKCE